MRKLYSFILCVFLLTVRAEKDFQGHHTEQTKGATVIKDLLLKKKNSIGHGREATTVENTHRATVSTAKFPGVVLLDTRPTPPYERAQTTKASTISPSTTRERFVSRNGHISLTPTRDNPSPMSVSTGSEPLISSYQDSVFSSPQATFDSMLNGTLEPEVHPSAGIVKPFFWLHTLLDNRYHRNTKSIALTSAEAEPRVPIVSESHPRVTDNLDTLPNDNDDKRSQGKDERGISNLGKNEYLFGTMRSIFQNDTADDSVSGNTVTNLCLTCLNDRRVSTEKSMAPPTLSADASSVSLHPEGLTSDPSQFTTSLPSLHQQSEELRETLNKEIIHQNMIKYSNVSMKEQLFFSLNKTVNHSQSILNNSQIKYFFSGTVESSKQSLAEMSLVTPDNKKQMTQTYPGETFVSERQYSTTVLYRPSKLPYEKNGEQKVFGKKVSIGDPESKLIYFNVNNRNASQSPSTNFKNIFLQNQPLDLSSGSVSNTPVSSEAPQSSEKRDFPQGSDHSTASHPTARMRLIESQSTLFSLSEPTTSIFVLKSQTPAKPGSETKEPHSTFSPKASAIKSASITTKRHLTEEQDSQMLNIVNSIFKQPVVDALVSAEKPGTKEPQTLTFTTRTAAVPVKLFPSEPRRGFDDDVVLTLTALSRKSSSERTIMNHLLGNQSKNTQERTFDVSSYYHLAPIHQSFATYNTLVAHNRKEGDKYKQVLTVVAENGDWMEGKQIREMKEIIKFLEELGSSEIEKLESKSEKLFSLDKTETRNKEEIISSEKEINENTDREEEKMETPQAKIRREGDTSREEDVTLKQDKVRDKAGDGRKGETIINTDIDLVEKREILKKQAEVRREETVGQDDIRHNINMKNVSLGSITNSEELHRDKEHTVTNLPYYTLIKQLRASEHQTTELGENMNQRIELKNELVTINQTPLHSTLTSQNPKISRMTSLPKKSHTQINTRLSTLHRDMSSPATLSAQNKVAEATFSATAKPKMLPKLILSFGACTSKFCDKLNPTMSLLSGATTSTHPVVNNITNMLSLTTPRLPITAGFLRTRSHFTLQGFTPTISAHRHKFSTSASKMHSLIKTTNGSEKVQNIIPTQIFETSVKNSLTSNMTEEVHISTSVNAAPPQQMYNDSSTRTATATALSSEAQLQPHQGQSAPQISQSSSSDVTRGQPCSFKPSVQAAHSDALHAPVDDNKQRSVQTLMASMSPEAKNDQFPRSSMSPLLNIMLFGGDSLPGTYHPTGLTRSSSEKETLKANSGAEYANSGSGQSMSLLGTTDGANQTEEYGGVQTILTSTVKHSDVVTKQTAGSRDEKNSPPLIAQTVGKSKHDPNSTDEFKAFPMQTEKLAGKKTTEDDNDDLPTLRGSNNTVKMYQENNYLSQMEGDETSTEPPVFTIQTTHTTKREVSEDFLPVVNDGAVVNSDSLLEMPQIQTNDVTNNAISVIIHHLIKTTEKQHYPFAPQGISGDNAIPVPHNFRSDNNVPDESTWPISDQIMNVTSEFQIATTKSNGFVSLAPAESKGGPVVTTEAHESVLTTSESMKFVTEKSFQAAHAESKLHTKNHTETVPLREPATPTPGKLTPAMTRKNTTKTQIAAQPKHELSVRAIEKSLHISSDMISITPSTHLVQEAQTGLLGDIGKAGWTHDRTQTAAERAENLPKDNRAALGTKSAIEDKYFLHQRPFAARTVHSEQTSISQGIFGAVADSVPSTEIINTTNCGKIACTKSGKTTKTTIGPSEIDHTAPEKMHKTQIGNIRTDDINPPHIPLAKTEDGNCSTDLGKATPQAARQHYVVLSTAASKSDQAPTDETVRKYARNMTDESSKKTQGFLVESYPLERRGTPEQVQFAEVTTQRRSHEENSGAQEAAAAKVTLSEPEASMAQTTIKSTEQTLLNGKKSKTQLNRGAGKAETFEKQNAIRSACAVAKEETAVQESGRRLLLLETGSESELPSLNHRRRSSPHLYLSGVTEVSDEMCGSGNYTAEMSLNLGRGVEPGDAVPALGILRVVINLKTNNSQLNLEVTSCCLSPTIQPDLTNSTCCLFSRLAAEPAGITLLPSALSTSASFTISLFQMINYSVAYLHCDLSVCLRNRSDCERQCLQQRSAFPLEAIVTNLRNRISFGPMLKEMKNSTFSEEIDPADLDLVLVIASLVTGSSLVTVILLLLWLAYRHRAIWPLHSSSPPKPCCGCLHRGGDLILP